MNTPFLDRISPGELLRRLVAVDSRSPGALTEPVPAGAPTEEGVCALVEGWLGELGFACERQYPAPRRPQLLARRQRHPGAPTLAFSAHFDTVGTDGMTVPPFAGELRDGRLYGRGACDTKGSHAAMLLALARLCRESLPLNLMYIGTCAEESGVEGARQLRLGTAPPDAVIVGEPTGNRLVAGHKGHRWLELAVHGRAAHGSTPEAGDNAIYRMAEAILALRRLAAGELARETRPGFTPQTLAVTVVHGGDKVNIIPALCRIQVDLRLFPDTDADALARRLLDQVREESGHSLELLSAHGAGGFGCPPESPLRRALETALRETGGDPAATTVSYCTDAGAFAGFGIDTLVFGPGDIRHAHGPEEFIELAELEAAIPVLAAAARAFAAAH
ncbi:MAG: M20/M25/M40 family metallo-hydrolase [Lentisphaeria bacterium]